VCVCVCVCVCVDHKGLIGVGKLILKHWIDLFPATHCYILQQYLTHRNTLQHTATHCNTLQHSATLCATGGLSGVGSRFGNIDSSLQEIVQLHDDAMNLSGPLATRCNTLQHAATRCNMLQRSATPCNTLQHSATLCNTLCNALQPLCNSMMLQ